ncbi:Putative electron transport protein YccM [Maioricimonas rarisocia]|uniref:Electron transport protein YccM n=1 Tax=Maioricimonas rarisocia TaxID=2528026 RepID=A0A517Z700_9PLAN|nr:FMN-binding protein [Maioricimonas rarisocia]QDU38257.1 Putative electron transport protein YccM [Maioricimonas rarisocia]
MSRRLPARPSPWKGRAIHSGRILLFCAAILLIHWQHARVRSAASQTSGAELSLEEARSLFPAAVGLGDATADGGRQVLDDSGETLGTLLQTSPQADHIVGFSGPTNVLIGFDSDGRIAGLHVLSSGDTKDHVRQVVEDDSFMRSFDGMTREAASRRSDIDAVSGATLTSLAMAESVIHRLGGAQPSLRFPDPVSVEMAEKLFPEAADVVLPEATGGLWSVRDARGKDLGTLVRLSPAADNIVGYQGPTDGILGLGPDGAVIGLVVGETYDNEPYIDYVRDEKYFLNLFNEKPLAELAQLDPYEEQIEGVSGATMTSLAVVDGIVAAAKEAERIRSLPEPEEPPLVDLRTRDIGTAAVVLGGLLIGFTRLRGVWWIRLPWLLLVIGYLGFINGDMVSQAMLVGWAQSGVPWRSAAGLVLLTVAAFIVPFTSRTNLYCSHLCPHGAVQQLIRPRKRRRHPPRRVIRVVALIPGLLLAWVMIVAMGHLPFSLVDIEPFDAYVFRIAGWATITVAVVGLIASAFVPMAYCRYGCPTGALLDWLRLNARSDRLTWRDGLAVGLVLLALGYVLAG